MYNTLVLHVFIHCLMHVKYEIFTFYAVSASAINLKFASLVNKSNKVIINHVNQLAGKMHIV